MDPVLKELVTLAAEVGGGIVVLVICIAWWASR